MNAVSSIQLVTFLDQILPGIPRHQQLINLRVVLGPQEFPDEMRCDEMRCDEKIDAATGSIGSYMNVLD
jgi:hypothetical protein